MTVSAIIRRVSFIFLLVGLSAISGLLGLWTADRHMPVVILESTLLTPEVPAGEAARVRYTVIRTNQCRATVERYLVASDGLRFDLGYAIFPNGTGPTGRPDQYVREYIIPAAAPPGPARLVALACYQCNPIHAIWPVCAAADIDLIAVVAPHPAP
jgi:hypothetical protein